jgi:two-component system, LytTR family, response regulator
MKIKTIIIDDEKYARKNLLLELTNFSNEIEIIGEAHNVETAVNKINELKPDLIFLDIHLGDGTGFDVLDRITNKKIMVVFLTAFDQYAIKALKTNALDYMLKPLNKKELVDVLSKVREFELEKQEMIQALLQEMKKKNSSQKIAISSSDGLKFYPINSIVRCQSNGNYTNIFFENKKKITASKTLKHFEEILIEHQFERVHNSHLINLKFISKYVNKDNGYIVLNDGEEIPISQRKKSVVLATLEKI